MKNILLSLIKDFILTKNILIIIVLNIYCNLIFMQEAVDGIVAAVEDRIILKSDVVLNMQLSGVQLSQYSPDLEIIYNDFVNQMIDDYVLLIAAEKDTNIVIDNNMVDLRLNEYINNLIKEVGSEEKIISTFNKPMREIKYYYRRQIYDAMLREMYIYSYLGDLETSRKEVELFYESYKDSLPIMPGQYNFSVIEIPIAPSQEEINKVKKIQLDLLDQLNDGASFSDLAKEFSEDSGTASLGGDQGYYWQGTLFPEFEETAFALELNEMSPPIRTPIGFHIIKLLDKKNDQIHTQHILNLINITPQDEALCLSESNSIYATTINDPGMFDSLAMVYQKKYNNNSGVYNNYLANNISSSLKEIIINSEEYILTKPVLDSKKSNYKMIYVYKIIAPSYPTLKNAWLDIEKYTKNKKQNDLLMKLIKKLKHKTFIKYYN